MRPQQPRMVDGKEAWERFEAELAAWKASPEGMEEARRQAEHEAKEEAETSGAYSASVKVQAQRLIDSLEMPPRALLATKAPMIPTEALKSADKVDDILVLSGASGCGKTVAACRWVSNFCLDGMNWRPEESAPRRAEFIRRRPIWVTAARLSRWERYDEEKMAALLSTPCLVIDDLGGEYMDKSGFYASLLDEIINERQGHSRPTILTTNLDVDAFRARYGERIADRIREGGRFVGCGNKSLRKRERQAG